jgi:hypothetical protein
VPESKLRRIAALATLVLAVILLALAGGGNAFAAGAKAPWGAKGAKAAPSRAAKVVTRVRFDEFDPPIDPGGDGGGPIEPPSDSHFGW